MPEQKQTPPQQQQESKDEKDERSDDVKQAQKDSASPDDKHDRYLKDLERIHGEK
jgi:hypothetical protein